jgi:molybdopterin-guanine dinucleotide biosynthesis protein A
MGSPKPALDWHGSTLLRRVTGILARAVSPGPVVVVSAPGQTLPALPTAIEVVTDARPGRGPLQGLAAGLAALDGYASVGYVSSVDVPLLHPAFVRAVLASVLDGEVDAAVPEVGGHRHPLAAAYRVSLRGVVDQLLSEDQLALGALLDRCRVRRLAGAELPAPYSVMNLNEPGDYERALALGAPGIDVNDSVVPAWMLGDVLPGRVAATLNGEPVDPDPELPLVAGDVVAF